MTTLKNVVSTVVVECDEYELGIVSGSLEYLDGFATRDHKGQDDGSVAVSENQEEAVGMIKFELVADTDNLKKARILKRRKAVLVKFYNDDGFQRVMREGSTTNSDPTTTGADGKDTLEFKGLPLE